MEPPVVAHDVPRLHHPDERLERAVGADVGVGHELVVEGRVGNLPAAGAVGDVEAPAFPVEATNEVDFEVLAEREVDSKAANPDPAVRILAVEAVTKPAQE